MHEFIQKVAEMRRLQRMFYKTHDRGILVSAKAAEYEVDTMLESIGIEVGPKKATKAPAKQNNDPKLF